MNRRKSSAIFETVRDYLALILVAVFVLLPYYWMIVTALKPTEEVVISPSTLWPSRISLDNFVEVWKLIPMARYLKNSFVVAIIVTILGVILATLCGYSISRFSRRKPQKVTFITILCSQLIPGVVSTISLYFMMYDAGLNNTYLGLIIAYAGWAIPFCVLMIKGYFDAAIPREIEESAKVDGCGQFKTFLLVCLPISIPGIISTAIFSFITAWNEYMWASILLSSNELKPASVGIYDFIGQFGANNRLEITMTAGILITLPAMILFGFLQKYLISGLTAGAVKG